MTQRRSFVQSMDFYRQIPKDLTQASSLGTAMSILALATMAVLFVSETWAFASASIKTSIDLDDNTDPHIRINFDITLMDLSCDYVSVDVLDSLGTNRQNVTKDVHKWKLDSEGRKKTFLGGLPQRHVEHEEHEETLEELHEDGVHAHQLTDDSFQSFLDENEYSFVNFYKPSCTFCKGLHHTWEKFAEKAEAEEMPVGIADVDCAENWSLCRDQKIQAFPSLQWFLNGQQIPPEYRGHRTVEELFAFAKKKLAMDEKLKYWEKNKKADDKTDYSSFRKGLTEHQGCQVSGHLMVNRVPGNFHIQARSKSHDLSGAMTNLTHRVNHLSFGEPHEESIVIHSREIKMKKSPKLERILKQVPPRYKKFNTIDGNVYQTEKYHEAFHHYIKVVSTHLQMGKGVRNSLMTYQFLEQNQIVHYDETDVPEARFSYDISPMSVVVEKDGRKWYDYMTSVCAIIGGTFTTLGLIDGLFNMVFKAKII